VGPRVESYHRLHQLRSIFVPISIQSWTFPEDTVTQTELAQQSFCGDEIQIRAAAEFQLETRNEIKVSPEAFHAFEEVSERGSTPEKNLLIRAARLLQGSPANQSELPPIRIQLTKRIPPGSGIGAGSANAAMILRYGLEQKFITSEQAMRYASELGADVAFFLQDRPALVEGFGHRIRPLSGPEFSKRIYGVLCFPGIFVSTAQAYTALKRPLQDSADAKLGSLLRDSDWSAMASGKWDGLSHWLNDFEAPVFSMHPFLGEIKKSIASTGSDYCSLSGSGSALYGLYSSSQKAYNALELLKSRYPELQFETFAIWE
jgi:4-diphosphocytidyl-2-C-methyl-D-erythritol kinase